jgi:hypothetical protein
MKKLVLAMLAVVVFASAPAVFAQDHGVIGVYADLTRLHSANDQNFWGLGGRAGFNIHPNVQLEGEMSYDFARDFTISTTGGGTVTTSTTSLRMLHGLFGPKFQTSGPVRIYGVLKGGFINFSANRSLTGQFGGITTGDTHAAFYPGAGIELYAGWFGIRAEVGDLMYFASGANNNLRFTFGPQIRF